jgi:nucleotide-binding universal stress UspA family protein
VIEDPFAGSEHVGMLMAVPEGYFEQLDLRSRARLTSLLSEDQRRQYRAVFATRMGHAAPEILAYVDDHGAIDLVVIASTGRGAVSRLVMGSLTDKVMRAAPCPVLLVHSHDRAESGDRTRRPSSSLR